MDYGFKVVLSSRYADIFRGNSGKAGLVTAEVSQDVIEKIWALIEKDANTPITVDLDKRQVKAGDLVADFQIDDYVRWRLMEGLDDIGLTLRHESKITEFEKTRPSYKPQTV
jgi:3-isopropylmalate/(R)-2-methylmalate dehydratase small subunit